ncbi:MAG: S8 family serine peptidase, partial [Clostridiales bacterium]|nr:S8 family serine peptidase [Clostridiales bacterium]
MPENAEIIVRYNGDLEPVGLALDAQVEILGESIAILTLPPERIPELFDFKQIEFIELPKTLSLSLRESLADACITPAAQNYGLSGRGVLIGVIDSGIDYAHPDFRDGAGNSRVLFLWDQLGEGEPPRGFNHGVEYNNSQLNEILQGSRANMPSQDIVGHGTPVAAIAAGNGGVAPDASLIVVRLGRRGLARTTEIMRSIKYIMDYATELNMPVVINISFGTNNGSHAGDSLFEEYIDGMAQRWRCVIVVAMGNEAAAGHHFKGNIQTNQTLVASFTVSENLNSLFLTLWKNFADTLDLELIAPGGQSCGILRASEQYFRQINLGNNEITINYRQPTVHSRSQEAFFQFSGNPVTQGIWRLRI